MRINEDFIDNAESEDLVSSEQLNDFIVIQDKSLEEMLPEYSCVISFMLSDRYNELPMYDVIAHYRKRFEKLRKALEMNNQITEFSDFIIGTLKLNNYDLNPDNFIMTRTHNLNICNQHFQKLVSFGVKSKTKNYATAAKILNYIWLCVAKLFAEDQYADEIKVNNKFGSWGRKTIDINFIYNLRDAAERSNECPDDSRDLFRYIQAMQSLMNVSDAEKTVPPFEKIIYQIMDEFENED